MPPDAFRASSNALNVPAAGCCRSCKASFFYHSLIVRAAQSRHTAVLFRTDPTCNFFPEHRTKKGYRPRDICRKRKRGRGKNKLYIQADRRELVNHTRTRFVYQIIPSQLIAATSVHAYHFNSLTAKVDLNLSQNLFYRCTLS